ncbi:hypothetical protein KIPB_008367 [Kipferlia bialata]|uniref:RCC1-like domain-containing protein n=1 Tax=Kipferlia bialata TaxID=797122 RepID=A0A9K3D299_9EUKA|nr:hypothetical protein KIPB_008367 [Kipferlia bialata]|eukprot:g8367.t1
MLGVLPWCLLALLAVSVAGVPTMSATGLNDYGQLGLGDETDRDVMTSLGTYTFNGETPVDVCAGNYHTVVLTSEGHVFTMGYNDRGQLGRGLSMSSSVYSTSPEQITPASFDAHKIVHIACGFKHTLVIDDANQVWGFGENKYYQLGLSDDTDRSSPVLIPVPTTSGLPEQASLGECTSYIITTTGQIWAFGRNNYGQARPGSTRNLVRPVPLEYLPEGVSTSSHAVKMSPGNSFLIVLLDSGELVGLGKNDDGELGIGTTASVSTPQKVLAEWGPTRAVVDISSGGFHSLTLLDDGNVYCWGYNAYKDCSSSSTIVLPTPVAQDLSPLSTQKATQIAAGYSSSYVVDTNGAMYARGQNDLGELGTGSTGTATAYTPVVYTGAQDYVLAISSYDSTFMIREDTSVVHTDHTGTIQDTKHPSLETISHVIMPSNLMWMHLECSGDLALGLDKLSIGQGMCGLTGYGSDSTALPGYAIDKIEWYSVSAPFYLEHDMSVDLDGSTSDCFYVDYQTDSPAYDTPRWQCTYNTTSYA